MPSKSKACETLVYPAVSISYVMLGTQGDTISETYSSSTSASGNYTTREMRQKTQKILAADTTYSPQQ